MKALASVMAALVLLGGSPAAAQEGTPIDPAAQYKACMSLTRLAPEDAFESALRWEGLGGGDPAKHCGAVALVALGFHEEGARRLELLASRLAGRDRAMAGNVLAQSGQAWLLAEQPGRAYAAQTSALDLRPNDVEILIDRAITLAGLGQYWEAIDDLNLASELAPRRAEVLIFRANAYRLVEVPELALEDIGRALALDPASPEGFLERGILRRQAGDLDGARRDWIRVLSLAPGSPAGKSARANLEKLDVRVD